MSSTLIHATSCRRLVTARSRSGVRPRVSLYGRSMDINVASRVYSTTTNWSSLAAPTIPFGQLSVLSNAVRIVFFRFRSN